MLKASPSSGSMQMKTFKGGNTQKDSHSSSQIPQDGGNDDGEDERAPMIPVRIDASTHKSSRQPPASLDARSERRKLSPLEIHGWSALLGVLISGLVKLYGITLRICVYAIWTWGPEQLFAHVNSSVTGPSYTVAACTLGGILVGSLGPLLPPGYGVGVWVMHAADGGSANFPGLACLVPVCILSLITAAAGFSVGPEAPMVCVGGVVGARLAAKLPRCSSTQVKVLSIAGASAALSAFLNMPLAGCFFALELLDPTSSLGVGGADSLSPSAVASVAAVISLAMMSTTVGAASVVGGDFNYMGGLTGPASEATTWPSFYYAMALMLGATGGFLSVALVLVIKALKRTAAWLESPATPAPPPAAPTGSHGSSDEPIPKVEQASSSPHLCASSTCKVAWRPVAVRAMAGFLTGVLGVFWPHTLLWGETRLGTLLAQSAADTAVHPALTSYAWVGLGGAAPSPGLEVGQVALAKCAAIAIAAGAGLPGGVIFPTFYAGALVAQAIAITSPATKAGSAAAVAAAVSSSSGWVAASWLPVASVCLMASIQAATTRTPLASIMILSMAADFSSNVGALLPFMVVSAYTGVWVAQLTGTALFGYPQPSQAIPSSN